MIRAEECAWDIGL